MPFYLIKIELAGKTITGVRENSCSLDHAYLVFKSNAQDAFGDKMLNFECTQLSKHSEAVIALTKGRNGKTTYVPEKYDDFGIEVDPNYKYERREKTKGPAKYKG